MCKCLISNISSLSVPGPEIIIIKPWQNKAQTAEVRSLVCIMIAPLDGAEDEWL